MKKVLFASILLIVIGSSCAPRRPGPVVSLPQDTASPLIRSALKLHAASDYTGAADYFMRAVEASPTSDLRRRCLAAAALSYLKAGEREKFLAAEGRLEEEFTDIERRLPPRELADVVTLGRVMRGEAPPQNTSEKMSRLLFELRLNR